MYHSYIASFAIKIGAEREERRDFTKLKLGNKFRSCFRDIFRRKSPPFAREKLKTRLPISELKNKVDNFGKEAFDKKIELLVAEVDGF